jgi:hypothetical protein
MEAAGLALALPQLFSSCIQGYRSLQTIRDFGKDSRLLQCKLEIEAERLNLMNLDVGSVSVRSEALVRNILLQIQRLTCDASELRSKYGLEFVGTRAESPRTGESVPKVSKMGRVIWATFDKDNMEQLVTELRALNDGLFDLLRGEQQATFRDMFRIYCIKTINTLDLTSLRGIAEASQGSYVELASPATQKAIRLEAELAEHERRISEICIEDSLLSIDAFTAPLYQNAEHNIVMHRESRSLHIIEWRAVPGDASMSNRIQERMSTLSRLLQAVKPATLRTLHCMGYLLDRPSQSVGLVYSYPPNSARQPPKSLYEYLTSPESKKALPSLNDRYVLAHKLAESISQLHMSGWLHKGIRSQSVLFFSGKEVGAAPAPKGGVLRQPFLCGFEFSREDTPGAISETLADSLEHDRYRHPDCQGSARIGYKKLFDIYR